MTQQQKRTKTNRVERIISKVIHNSENYAYYSYTVHESLVEILENSCEDLSDNILSLLIEEIFRAIDSNVKKHVAENVNIILNA